MKMMKGICLNQNCTSAKNTIRPLVERQQGKCGYCRMPLDFPVEKREEVIFLSRVPRQRVFAFVN